MIFSNLSLPIVYPIKLLHEAYRLKQKLIDSALINSANCPRFFYVYYKEMSTYYFFDTFYTLFFWMALTDFLSHWVSVYFSVRDWFLKIYIVLYVRLCVWWMSIDISVIEYICKWIYGFSASWSSLEPKYVYFTFNKFTIRNVTIIFYIRSIKENLWIVEAIFALQFLGMELTVEILLIYLVCQRDRKLNTLIVFQVFLTGNV